MCSTIIIDREYKYQDLYNNGYKNNIFNYCYKTKLQPAGMFFIYIMQLHYIKKSFQRRNLFCMQIHILSVPINIFIYT